MKKFLKSSATILLTSVFFLAVMPSSFAMDIVAPNAKHFIKVQSKSEFRSFSICQTVGSGITCEQLGDRQWYAVKDLQDQRVIELAQAVASTVGAAAVTVSAFVGGVFVADMLAGGSLILMNVIGIAIPIGTFSLANMTNPGPAEQFRQQYLLRDDVVNDVTIVLKTANDQEVKQIAARLEMLLNKLN